MATKISVFRQSIYKIALSRKEKAYAKTGCSFGHTALPAFYSKNILSNRQIVRSTKGVHVDFWW